MMNRYDEMKRTIHMYAKEEDLKARANYMVYILDWSANDLPDCPTEIVKVFYAEDINEEFLDMAFAHGYFGYPVCICDKDLCDPNSFIMHDVLSACTVRNFEAAKKEYDEKQKKSLEELLKTKEAEEGKKKGRTVSVLIFR